MRENSDSSSEEDMGVASEQEELHNLSGLEALEADHHNIDGSNENENSAAETSSSDIPSTEADHHNIDGSNENENSSAETSTSNIPSTDMQTDMRSVQNSIGIKISKGSIIVVNCQPYGFATVTAVVPDTQRIHIAWLTTENDTLKPLLTKKGKKQQTDVIHANTIIMHMGTSVNDIKITNELTAKIEKTIEELEKDSV